MQIVETHIFTRRIQSIMPDDEYRELQSELISKPSLGKVMPGSGGVRKLRWSGSGRGKRGGSRILYYWFVEPQKILMLYAYLKKEQADLTRAQVRMLRQVVEEEYRYER